MSAQPQHSVTRRTSSSAHQRLPVRRRVRFALVAGGHNGQEQGGHILLVCKAKHASGRLALEQTGLERGIVVNEQERWAHAAQVA